MKYIVTVTVRVGVEADTPERALDEASTMRIEEGDWLDIGIEEGDIMEVDG